MFTLTMMHSPDLSRVVTYNPVSQITVISDLQQESIILRDTFPTCVLWSPDSREVALGCANNAVVIYHTAQGLGFPSMSFGPLGNRSACRVVAMAWSPESQYLAIASGDGAIRIWPKGCSHVRWLSHLHQSPCHVLSFSPDGQYLASASLEGTIGVWKNARLLLTWECPVLTDELSWRQNHLLVKRNACILQAIPLRNGSSF